MTPEQIRIRCIEVAIIVTGVATFVVQEIRHPGTVLHDVFPYDNPVRLVVQVAAYGLCAWLGWRSRY